MNEEKINLELTVEELRVVVACLETGQPVSAPAGTHIASTVTERIARSRLVDRLSPLLAKHIS